MSNWIKVCDSLGCHTTDKYKINFIIGYIIQEYEVWLEVAINMLISANIKHSRLYGRPIAYFFDITAIDPKYNTNKLSSSDIAVINDCFSL